MTPKAVLNLFLLSKNIRVLLIMELKRESSSVNRPRLKSTGSATLCVLILFFQFYPFPTIAAMKVIVQECC